ncbi:formate/nitrite transporter family protein [Hyphomicrobium sp. CS1BSMeth3]|uniref:formate/nitrite transporter family protein n=1 Tax=Hyphomicrobium sp. CS1BSMeth3 TaxID=1892844 RepID=UPI001160CE98
MPISEHRIADLMRFEPRTQQSPTPVQASPSEVCAPAEIADRLCLWSSGKVALSFERLAALGILGGLYIGFGGALATMVVSESSLGAGPTRWLGGIAFSLGLVLVCLGGAELSTGNCLMAMARLRRLITARQLWRNWTLSYLANGLGALGLAWIVFNSGVYDAEPLRSTAIRIAEAKLALSPAQAFLKGVLANALVCLAVWLSFASHNAVGKVLGIVFPISAFVALGFEHSIANLYLIPAGLMAGAAGGLPDLARNIAWVTGGNLIGGAVVVPVLLWLGHARRQG